METRKDLRDARVFTIDPDTAKDIDDALSVQLNEDGTYDVGVHISDVSFFVKSNTALDRDARKRATGVYLVQRAVPMLPPMLSEQLCSLLPGQDRLTFSVIFTMDADAKVQKKWYGKTIIRLVWFSIIRFRSHFFSSSAAKLAYQDAQRVIDGNPLGEALVDAAHGASRIEKDINILQGLANKLRARRFKEGALNLEVLSLAFKLDENGLPIDCGQYKRTDANHLIEEVGYQSVLLYDFAYNLSL